MNPAIRRATAFLLKDRIVASPGFNRWWIPLISVALHLCIGSVYSWSIFNLTMYVMAALLVVAFFDNMRMRDMAERFVTRVPR